MSVTVEATHVLYPRGNGAVEVTVTAHPSVSTRTGDGTLVVVTVDCLPGYSWWTCPDARTMRRLVDQVLNDTGRKRDGQRIPGGYRTNGWMFTYPTVPTPS